MHFSGISTNVCYAIVSRFKPSRLCALTMAALACLALDGRAEFCPSIGNDSLSVSVSESGDISVFDRQANRRWQSSGALSKAAVRLSNFSSSSDSIGITLVPPKADPVRATLTLSGRELVVRLEAAPETPLKSTLAWPYPFAAEDGDRLMLPKACCCALDVHPDKSPLPEFDRDQPFYRYRNRMGCWGHYAEGVAKDGSLEQGAGMLVIVETPEDALYNAGTRSNGLRSVNVGWCGEWERFGYARTIRYCFFERATPGAMAERYRREMDRRGYRVTFREKARRNPRVKEKLEILKGAPDIWYWSTNSNRGAIARDLRRRGMRNFLFGAVTRRDLGTWVTPEEVREVAEIPNVLCCEYDIFVDTLEPAFWDKVDCLRPHWPLDVWENGDYLTDAKGEPQRGWKVALKENPAKPVVGCILLCEKQAPAYARRRIAQRLAEAPYGARFLDVTGTRVTECHNPRHAMTRRESGKARRELVGLVGKEFGLVAGTEDGMECLVPTSDYFEGGFSSSWGRGSGREMWTLPEPTARVESGVDPTIRCPFFELVFHDCVINYWYWSDYNNRYPTLWWKFDLLNAVCGTPPMYLFTEEYYEKCKNRIGATVEHATSVARDTADALMTEYRWLTADRLVQESTFSNGIKIVANFSEKPFRLPDGKVVPPHDYARRALKDSQ